MSIIPCGRQVYILTSHTWSLHTGMGTVAAASCTSPKQSKKKPTQPLANASPLSRLAQPGLWRCTAGLLYFMARSTLSYKSSHLGLNKHLNSPLGQREGAADTHTFCFGGLLLHVLGMSLAQVMRCCHGRRGEGHVADGTTLVPVLPIAAFLLAVLCTENH